MLLSLVRRVGLRRVSPCGQPLAWDSSCVWQGKSRALSLGQRLVISCQDSPSSPSDFRSGAFQTRGLCTLYDGLSRSCPRTLLPPFSSSNFVLIRTAVRLQHQQTDARGKEPRMNDDGSPKQEDEMRPSEAKLTQRQRLKRAVSEYGATVIVFHTCISLFTLGVSYLVVSSGVDVIGLMAKVGIGQAILESKLATGASTFVVAYAVHKVFAPARMACTLTATPFIVRYLRKIGFLKAPAPKS